MFSHGKVDRKCERRGRVRLRDDSRGTGRRIGGIQYIQDWFEISPRKQRKRAFGPFFVPWRNVRTRLSVLESGTEL